MDKNNRDETDMMFNIAIDILSSTSFHGIPNIIRTKRQRIRMLWVIFFLISFSICSYLVVESVLDFFSYEVVTKIRKVYEFPRKFPKITFCNANSFSSYESTQFLDTIIANFSHYIQLNYDSDLNDLKANMTTLNFIATSYAASDLLTDEQRKQLGQSINKFVLSCKFSDLPCDINEFNWYYHNFYGNCYEYNSGYDQNKNAIDIKNSTKSGHYDALQLELYAPNLNYLSSFSPSQGVIVFVRNQDELIMPYKFYFASVGTETNLMVSQIITQKLKKPYSNCEIELPIHTNSHDSILFKEYLKQNLTLDYTQESCLNMCYQRFAIKRCGCYDTSGQILVSINSKPCLVYNDILCVYQVYGDYMKEHKEECLKNCPLECGSNTYTVSISFSDYPSKAYAKVLLSNKIIKQELDLNNYTLNDFETKEKFLKKNLLKLNIYFDSLDYVMINEYPSTNLISLFSSIGGTMGLFLGISVLSFIEIVELFVELFIVYIENYQINKSKNLNFSQNFKY